MKSQKIISLIGLIISISILVLLVAHQHSFSPGLLIASVILTLFLSILSWQYAFLGNCKKSILPALKITLIVVIVGAVIGFLKRLGN